jgi:hypothetical protein
MAVEKMSHKYILKDGRHISVLCKDVYGKYVVQYKDEIFTTSEIKDCRGMYEMIIDNVIRKHPYNWFIVKQPDNYDIIERAAYPEVIKYNCDNQEWYIRQQDRTTYNVVSVPIIPFLNHSDAVDYLFVEAINKCEVDNYITPLEIVCEKYKCPEKYIKQIESIKNNSKLLLQIQIKEMEDNLNKLKQQIEKWSVCNNG